MKLFAPDRFLRSKRKSADRASFESTAPPIARPRGKSDESEDLCFPVACDLQAPRLRALEHNRGARESESCGDGGRSGSFAMTIAATALGPRVRPAAVAAGPRGSTHGGTVGAIATAANRQKCLRRRAPGATIARLDARHALGVGAGALRRGRGDAAARGARACRLQVNAHGDHGTSLAPSETYSTRRQRHGTCALSLKPQRGGASGVGF